MDNSRLENSPQYLDVVFLIFKPESGFNRTHLPIFSGEDAISSAAKSPTSISHCRRELLWWEDLIQPPYLV